MDNLIRRGRFRGIGNTLVSQRPAVINKNLLSQVGTMFFLQMIAPQDLDAVGSWLHNNIRGEVRETCRADIPILGVGVAYFLRGGDRPMFRKFSVRTKTTFDSSHTPKLNEEVVVAILGELSAEDRKMLDGCYGNLLEEAAKAQELVAEVVEVSSQELAASLGVQHGDDGDDYSTSKMSTEMSEALVRRPPGVEPQDDLGGEPVALPDPPDDLDEGPDLDDEEVRHQELREEDDDV
jgi:hypothetical protein